MLLLFVTVWLDAQLHNTIIDLLIINIVIISINFRIQFSRLKKFHFKILNLKLKNSFNLSDLNIHNFKLFCFCMT